MHITTKGLVLLSRYLRRAQLSISNSCSAHEVHPLSTIVLLPTILFQNETKASRENVLTLGFKFAADSRSFVGLVTIFHNLPNFGV